MIRKIQWIAMVVAAVLCAACDAHIDVPDTAVRPGHILCEDGTALSYVQSCGLRAQLCAAVGMHTVLAGKE